MPETGTAIKGRDLLNRITEATSGLVGKDFLSEVAGKVSLLMDMDYCFICECANEDKTRLRTVVFRQGEKILDNFEYNTSESGCRMMMNGETFFLPKGAQDCFPAAKGIEAYIGAPIMSPVSGEILGHIATTNTTPVTNEKDETQVLKILAVRIAAELERMKAEEELHKKLNEIKLFQTTLENLHEDIYWLDSSGKIIQVNESASRTSGYLKEELLQMTVFDLNPTEIVKDWPAHWKKVKEEKKVIIETIHKHKEGHLYDVEITNNFIESDGKEYFCSVVRDIRKRKLEEELLIAVSEATSGYVGQDYFRELAKFITLTLGVKYSLVSECANNEKTRVRTISFVDHSTPLENIEYDLEGTPCEIVMNGKDYFCANELEKAFPKEKGLQSYVSVPIYSPSTGEILGHIAALDDKPMSESHNPSSILKIFAARAGSEIERLKAEQRLKETLESANYKLQLKLKESEERFRDLFEEAPIAYVNEGLDSKFINANKAALKSLGVKPDEVPFMYGKTLVVDNPDNQKRLKEAFDSIEKGIDTGGIVLELKRKDNGKPLWIQWWSKPDPSGQYTRTMFIDITDKVLMEQEKNKLQAQNQYLQEEIKLTYNFDEIISGSKEFKKVLKQIEQVAATDATVLILGESGTGKELIARAIHNVKQPKQETAGEGELRHTAC